MVLDSCTKLLFNGVMVSKMITVTNPKGIHARPSALLVQTASEHEASITLELRGVQADARQIIEILSLGAFHGDVLKVTCEGPDEEDAMQKIDEIFALNFHDND